MVEAIGKEALNVEDVNLSIDLGSSLTKAVWSGGEDSPDCNFLTMEPEILQCAEEHLHNIRATSLDLYSTSREDLWVKLQKHSEVYAVGFLARALYAEVNLQALKYELALYKILAVVGEVAERLDSTHLSVNLGVLLPWSEWADRKKLNEQVGKALRSFWFRGKCYKVQLIRWKCLPEGSGITINRCFGFSQTAKLELL